MTKLNLFLFILIFPLASVASKNTAQDFLCSEIDENKQSSDIAPFKTFNYQLVARYPHKTTAFTQGLVFYQQNLFESSGLLNQSVVRQINIPDGKSLLKSDIPDIYFGEGLAVLNHQLVQMSWKSGKVFFFHPKTLKLIKRQNINMQVWGSTTINNQLVISDGSAKLFFIDLNPLTISKTLKITLNNRDISGLNELEYAEGYLYANVWPSACIIKINPSNGEVVDVLNLSRLVPTEYRSSDSAVLNGIAYQKQTKNFFVTGKFWPYLYEINWQSNEY